MAVCSQSVIITDDGSTTSPDASAILELKSDSRAFLMTRLSHTEIQAIALPATGLILYSTNDNKPVYYDGSDWLFFDGTTVSFSKKKSAPAERAIEDIAVENNAVENSNLAELMNNQEGVL